MSKYREAKLLEMAVDLTKAAFQHPSTDYLMHEAEQAANFIQAVYDKLKEINDSFSD